MRSIVSRARSIWRAIVRHDGSDADMNDEFRAHIEMRAADLLQSGLSPGEALRRARLEFGSVERYKHQGRESRGLRRFDQLRFSWLDVKLGARMLVKYPGLTIIGGLAMAFALWVGAATFEFLSQVVSPSLPLHEGSRVVGIRLWHAAAGGVEEQALHDFTGWRRDARTIVDLGAFRRVETNLIDTEGRGEPSAVVEISAAAFRLARVKPLLGRYLVEDDERRGAPPAVVIGHDLWLRRFAGDSGAVGRTVRLGDALATIVGIMPRDFGFPVADELWAPLRLEGLQYGPRRGPEVWVFGRLAPGVSLEEAQAELTTLGGRLALESPATHEHIRPQVMPYAKSILDFSGWASAGILSINIVGLLLLLLICGNVALLMFARAATREAEIVVRTALGASRGRIIMQLFAEALVLGVLAAVAGLAAAKYGLQAVIGVVEAEIMDGKQLPFWYSDTLSPTTVLYAAALTVLAAAIAGVLPAMKMTKSTKSRLRMASAGGGGLRFGGVWTAVIVVQIAVTVTFPVMAFFVRRDAKQIESVDVGFPAERYLSARLEMELPPGTTVSDSARETLQSRFDKGYRELERRLESESAVVGVTLADLLPRQYHPWRFIEMDEGGTTAPTRGPGHAVSAATISLDYFDVLRVPIMSGRGFHSGDASAATKTVIVNQPFVDQILGGRNPVGRRLRFLPVDESGQYRSANTQPGPWHEIVGVVRSVGMTHSYSGADFPGFYMPLSNGAEQISVAVQVSGDPNAFASRLRQLATEVDPLLRLDRLMPLSEVNRPELEVLAFWFRLAALVSAVALLLSLAGIYAVMSFAVSRRTREIGIRVALGADRRRVVIAVFKRPLVQVLGGILAGALVTSSLAYAILRDSLWPSGAAILLAYAVLMLGVCMLACVVPTRRALAVEPTEALRTDGC